MKIGIWQDLRNPPPWRRPWAEAYATSIERVVEAERLGIDAVWLSEHHFFEDGYLPQTLTYAAALAARTSRITIGTSILLAPLRPSIDIAEQAAIVDIISDGRFELGMGAGYRIPEFAAFGTTMAERMDRLEDRTREVRRLYDEGGLTPGPIQERMPIWVGGGSPRAARIAGSLGEGLMWAETRVMPHYTKALADAGHDPASARLATGVGLVVADDPEQAWARVAPHLEYQWQTYTRYGTEGLETDQSATAGVPEASAVTADGLRSEGPEMVLPRFDVVTAEEAVRRIRLWMADLPVEHAFFWDSIAGMDDDLVQRHIELIATEVAPALRDV